MTDTPSAQLSPEQPANPGIPEDLWGDMSAEERMRAAADAHEAEQTGRAIANTVAARQAYTAAIAALDAAAPAEAPDYPIVREKIEQAHQLLDRVREDLKAVHAVHVAGYDKTMWRAVWEHSQKQRLADLENARNQHDADTRAATAQRTEDMSVAKRNLRYVVVGIIIGGTVGLAGLIVAILTFVYTFYRNNPGASPPA